MTEAQYAALREKARENLEEKQTQQFETVDAIMEAVEGKESRETL